MTWRILFSVCCVDWNFSLVTKSKWDWILEKVGMTHLLVVELKDRAQFFDWDLEIVKRKILVLGTSFWFTLAIEGNKPLLNWIWLQTGVSITSLVTDKLLASLVCKALRSRSIKWENFNFLMKTIVLYSSPLQYWTNSQFPQ